MLGVISWPVLTSLTDEMANDRAMHDTTILHTPGSSSNINFNFGSLMILRCMKPTPRQPCAYCDHFLSTRQV